MKLFEVIEWQLTVSEEAWGLAPFKKILDRDKTKDKEVSLKEMLFIFFYCDIKSNYINFPPDQRESEIKHDIKLPSKWKIDKVIIEAIALYERISTSVVEKLYIQSLKAATDIGNYLENTEALLNERDENGRIVTDINKITQSVARIPILMRDLKAAYLELVKEREDITKKTKGSKKFNLFEDGGEVIQFDT